MATFKNVLSVIVTSNDLVVPMQHGDQRVKPHFPPGLRQNDMPYFKRLYALMSTPAVMQNVFLLFSRMPLASRAGEEFRPNTASDLGKLVATAMQNPRTVAVYRNLGEVLSMCARGTMPANDFHNALLRIVAREFTDVLAAEVAQHVYRDLKMRNVLFEADHGRRGGAARPPPHDVRAARARGGGGGGGGREARLPRPEDAQRPVRGRPRPARRRARPAAQDVRADAARGGVWRAAGQARPRGRGGIDYMASLRAVARRLIHTHLQCELRGFILR